MSALKNPINEWRGFAYQLEEQLDAAIAAANEATAARALAESQVAGLLERIARLEIIVARARVLVRDPSQLR